MSDGFTPPTMLDAESSLKLCDLWNEGSSYDMTKFWMDAGIEIRELQFSIYNPPNDEAKHCDAPDPIQNGKFDLNEPTNWRVFNVLSIFHNLSFEDMNKQPMGESNALIKLRWSNSVSKIFF